MPTGEGPAGRQANSLQIPGQLVNLGSSQPAGRPPRRRRRQSPRCPPTSRAHPGGAPRTAMDMGGLDNLIANTAYLQARKPSDADGRELRRWRRGLALPGPQDCAELRRAPAPRFHSLCEQQPIGRRLFRDFLATAPSYRAASAFLQELQAWELAEPGPARDLALRGLLATCAPAAGHPHPFLSPVLLTRCQAAATEEERVALVAPAKAEALAFLQDQPFRDFLASPFYDRFLQWKLFEMQPVSDKYFTEFRVLGKGGFGEVCAVQVKNTGKMYACKKLDKKRLKKKNGEQMALLEKEILEKVNSPFIVSLAYAFQNKSHLCLVMSLMNGGDLKFHIYSVGAQGLAMSRVVFYSAQMACALLHLHGLGIVYRDLKPENVLLDDLGNCRLSDMGLAVQVRDGKPVTQRAGTSGYMAPEILMDKASYSFPVDWFAMGCSIYEMVAGRTPFRDYKEKVSKEDLKQRTLTEEPLFQHENFTEDAKDICRLFLAKKPEQRLGSRKDSDDPRKHAFFQTINFPRLEAGLVEPPFVPDPSVVYAKDIDEIEDFSEVRGVEFDDQDKAFFKRFATGAVPIAWQEEILESGLFEELNDPNRPAGSGKGDASKSGVCALL
ncbi:PREDICTED: G protein-coupled receptor kinase 7 [Chinchilla lanigera]|uniref:G protein-coupled receptor kinase 7 n=1 Tax=Chinchilla lanigera TaxID=34839 RepID=UPI0006981C37|nr:PREDICTED: G protein-coupled receptor kinase 7 [Chinchilla lanigera]